MSWLADQHPEWSGSMPTRILGVDVPLGQHMPLPDPDDHPYGVPSPYDGLRELDAADEEYGDMAPEEIEEFPFDE